MLPYSRIVSPPGDVIVEEPSEVLTIHRNDLPEMIRECNEVTATLVHVMLDRARHFTSTFLHDEKLVSLGKLAAGMAHELNNPASAIGRSAGALSQSLADVEAASRALGAAEFTSRTDCSDRKCAEGMSLHRRCSRCFCRWNRRIVSTRLPHG